MHIDCDTCQAPATACGDCVMTTLLQLEPHPVEFDDAEVHALDALASVGLLPPLRLVVGVSAPHPIDSQLDPAADDDGGGPADSTDLHSDEWDERSVGAADRPRRTAVFRGIA